MLVESVEERKAPEIHDKSPSPASTRVIHKRKKRVVRPAPQERSRKKNVKTRKRGMCRSRARRLENEAIAEASFMNHWNEVEFEVDKLMGESSAPLCCPAAAGGTSSDGHNHDSDPDAVATRTCDLYHWCNIQCLIHRKIRLSLCMLDPSRGLTTCFCFLG